MQEQSRRFRPNLNLLISYGINSEPSDRIMWNRYFLPFSLPSFIMNSNLFTVCWFGLLPRLVSQCYPCEKRVFYYYLSYSFLSLTISEVRGLNSILRLYWTVCHKSYPIFYEFATRGCCAKRCAVWTDTLHRQLPTKPLPCTRLGDALLLRAEPQEQSCAQTQKSRVQCSLALTLKCRLISAQSILVWWALILRWGNCALVSPA